MSTNTSASFPVLSVLGLIFITLKLLGYIAWSWWWVLAPFWVPFAIILAVLVGYLAVVGFALLVTLIITKLKR